MSTAGSKPILLGLVLVILAGGIGLSLWIMNGQPKPVEPTAPNQASNNSPAHAQPPKDASVSPAPIASPVPKPAALPSEALHALSDPQDASPTAALDELMALAKKPRDLKQAEALRWLIYQADRGEVIRNEALVVLGAWNLEWLVGDLEKMMFDLGQSAVWRAYCVQHLKHHHAKHRDDASYTALTRAVEADAGVEWATVYETALFSLASLSMEQDWKTAQPERYATILRHLDTAMASPVKGRVVAGIRSSSVLGLKDRAPAIEGLAGDKARPLEIRVAAVQALGAIGREESRKVLEDCAKADEKILAQAAATALSLLSKRG